MEINLINVTTLTIVYPCQKRNDFQIGNFESALMYIYIGRCELYSCSDTYIQGVESCTPNLVYEKIVMG